MDLKKYYFSFIMGKDGSRHLSPAYNLCFILKTAATPQRRHEFSVRGKYEDIAIADSLAFAVRNDIKNPAKYIDKVKDALKDFRSLAAGDGVAPVFIDIMESRLRELFPDVFAPADGPADMIRFEATDPGNIHLYATIGGQKRRRVFTKKNEQYEAVRKTMEKRLSREERK